MKKINWSEYNRNKTALSDRLLKQKARERIKFEVYYSRFDIDDPKNDPKETLEEALMDEITRLNKIESEMADALNTV